MRLKKVAAAAVAMVMAVSMLSVPVFAEEDNSATNSYTSEAETSTRTNDTSKSDNNTATTDVKLFYASSSSQLSVTVPMSITIAIKGDKTLDTPSNYKIVNNSYVPVHVESIKVAAESGNNKYALVSDVSASNVSGNAMQLKMKSSATGATDVALLSGESDTISLVAGQWDIAATDDAKKGTECAISFSDGKVNKVDESLIKTKDSAVKLFTITYTIKAGKATTASSNTVSE